MHVPGVYVMPEPNMYRPYIEGMDPEASALACLEIGLKMFDMASAGRAAAIIVEPVIMPAACWCHRSRICRRCAARPTSAACC